MNANPITHWHPDDRHQPTSCRIPNTPQRTRHIYDPNTSELFGISRTKIDLFLNCPKCFYLDRRLGKEICHSRMFLSGIQYKCHPERSEGSLGMFFLPDLLDGFTGGFSLVQRGFRLSFPHFFVIHESFCRGSRTPSF